MRALMVIVSLLLCAGCTHAGDAMTVYAVDGLTRIGPGTRPSEANAIAIQAARNEYEPFQVIVHAGDQALTGVTAWCGDFYAPDGAVIASSNVKLFREQYVRVRKSTPRAKLKAGWYPDALIPFDAVPASAVRNTRFGGAPFDVPPGTNQPVWVDVFVPPDARAGSYSGIVTVTFDNHPPHEIFVELTVWDFTLPETPSIRSNFGKLSADIATVHGVAMNSPEFQIPEWHYATELARHRISPIIPNTLYPEVLEDGSIDPSRTHAGLVRWISTFHVTGFPLRLLGDDPAGADRERNLTHLRAMHAYLDYHGWADMAYVYVLDEPNTAEEYEEVRRRAALVHEAHPGIDVLCTEQPNPSKEEWGTLVGSVDIWVPSWPLFDEEAVAARLEAGDEVWSYTALSQGRRGRDTPYWQIDNPLLDYRIPLWTSFRYGLRGLLYFSPVWWRKTPDMWTDVATYTANNDVYNGEGALFYPGVAAGIDGAVASMRLKQVREGFEDYEYLKLLAEREGPEAALKVAKGLARSWTEWNSNPGSLYRAREAIARRLGATP